MAQQRNSGIDLLRVVSMFMVVVLHILGQGGILAALPPHTPRWALGWVLESACYCAVDCFGMVSGYVAHSRRFSARRCVTLWAQAAFYSAGIALLFKIFLPGSTSFRSILAACFPVSGQQYWYFTAYFALLFFAPFLTILLESLDRGQVKQLLAAVVGVFCLLPLAAGRDLFYLRAGYTTLWLCVLFLVGGCVRILEEGSRRAPGWYFGGYLLCVLLTVAVKGLPGRLPRADLFLSYTSPTVLGAALCLVLGFRALAIRSPRLLKWIARLAPLSFGVYLIHTHPTVWNLLLAGRFRAYAALPAPAMAALVLLTAAAIFLAGSGIDFLRERLFEAVLPPLFRAFARPRRCG